MGRSFSVFGLGSRMANRLPSKHTLYHQVYEALAQEGCPVCSLALSAVSRYLDALSYENVNDPRTRADMRAARGFCNRHAWQFVEEIHDGLGTAIIYRDVVATLLLVLHDRRGLSWPQGRRAAGMRLAGGEPAALAGRLAPERECPACRCLVGSSDRYLGTLLDHLGDAAFRARYEASDGLCAPHLTSGLRRARTRAERDALASAFLHRLGSLGAGEGPVGNTRFIGALVGAQGATSVDAPLGPAPALRLDGCSTRMRAAEREEATRPQACPICQDTIAAVDEFLAHVAAASTGGGQQAEAGPEPAALCNAHAWRLARVAGNLQAVRALQLQVPSLQARLQTTLAAPENGSMGWSSLSDRLARLGVMPRGGRADVGVGGHCPTCEAQAMAERRAALAMLSAPPQGAAGAQLCLPHLRVALTLAGSSEQALPLVAAQSAALQSLHGELSEYIRKQDYRFRHEPLGPEADSPWRAVAHVAGARGL